MQQHKTVAAIISGILILSSSTAAFSANYQSTTTTTTTTTTPPVHPKKIHYKGEGSYKGELPPPIKPPRQPVMEPLFLKDGPYVGITAGYDSYKVHRDSRGTVFEFTEIRSTDLNATGLMGGVVAGYGHYFNNALYLGGEVFLNTSEAQQSSNTTENDTVDTLSTNTKFLVSTGYGFAIDPGIKLSDSAMVYVRLGYQIARLRGTENSYYNGAATIVNATSSWNGGFSYGLGFEEAMVEDFSLRGEYVHTDYRSFSASTRTQYSPSNNQFLLSLLWHFG